ncbi:MAG TPA: GntR family transcriptional regulator [Burkholderiaceae bacterium]|nr:GntR family transcriptional regulator [Burkholderiaceae bacterium]
MPLALYQQIAADLTQKISSGEFAVGSLLPTEYQLMGSYGASRNTVRSALSQIETMGLISRKRNRGSTVEAQPGSASYSQSLTTLDDLISFAKSAIRQVQDSAEVVLDIPLARELGCVPGSRWLRISMTRTKAGGQIPLNWTDAYVDSHYKKMHVLAADHPDKLLSDLIESNYGRQIVKVEQTVTSCIISGTVLEKLKLTQNTHGLKIIRKYRDASKAVVLATRSIYPGDRYALTTTLVRG